MTWISRLLPDQFSPRRRATRSHQDRMAIARRRRRDTSLESLESRLVLSGDLAATYDPTTEVLTITRDTPGDIFTIQEHSTTHGGTVTITTAATPQEVSSQSIPSTTIDGSWTPEAFTAPGPVTNITINLPGGSLLPDTVNLLGEGGDVPTTVRNITINLPSMSQRQPGHRLTVNVGGPTMAGGVDISGALTINQPGTASTDGAITADILNSTFGSVAIDQTGCCPADVVMAGDHVSGSVSVSEGVTNGDMITPGNTPAGSPDVFGATTPVQGMGPVVPGYVGNGGTIFVGGGTTVRDLTIIQGGPGPGQQVIVDGLQVSAGSFGVRVTQNGAPSSDGPGAAAVVCNVTLIPGQYPNVPAVGAPTSIPGVAITQTGGGNYADASQITLPGNVTIHQDTGGGNYAEIIDSTIGLGFYFGPYWVEVAGTGDATISQKGDGVNTAILDHDVVNDATIIQGNNTGGGDCFGPAAGDLAQVNDTTIYSDLTITQGTSDAADTGSNTVAIATAVRTDDPGASLIGWGYPVDPGCFGNLASSPVTAFRTSITQFGPDNTVYLGGPTVDPNTGYAFVTQYLDVSTGGGGNATVYATYVDIVVGSYYGNGYSITGGGGGNLLILNIHTLFSSNGSVIADPNNYGTAAYDWGF